MKWLLRRALFLVPHRIFKKDNKSKLVLYYTPSGYGFPAAELNV